MVYLCVCWFCSIHIEDVFESPLEQVFFFLLYVQLYYACVVKCSCRSCNENWQGVNVSSAFFPFSLLHHF